ncbi:MAG: hypothetical protein EHM23_12915 [Acidobacteria bacterium]|nr:MAG: hypothetical protein EHM23_12915 [Acidobacteriota bacterium]
MTGGEGFRIFDVSNPSAPAEIGSFDAYGNVLDWATDGRYAYLAEGYAFEIVDISDPAHPVFVSRLFNFDLNARGISLVGRIACLSDPDRYYSGPLSFVDVSSALYPAAFALPKVEGRFHATASRGNYLYAIDYREGELKVFDLSDPKQLRLAGSCPAPAGVTGMALSETRLYASGNGKVHVFDVRYPGSPRWESSYVTAGTAEKVFVSGNLIFVADGPAGVSIFRGRR